VVAVANHSVVGMLVDRLPLRAENEMDQPQNTPRKKG
jgi:hypothetical protein